MCKSVRLQTGRKYGLVDFKRYTYDLGHLYRAGRGFGVADTGMLAHARQDRWTHCQHVVPCFTPFRQQLECLILFMRDHTS